MASVAENILAHVGFKWSHLPTCTRYMYQVQGVGEVKGGHRLPRPYILRRDARGEIRPSAGSS